MDGPPTPGRLSEELRELRAICARYDLTKIVDQIDDKLRDSQDLDDLLVFVVGEGNFGKSSLVNALLGSEVAKVSHLPLTWRIDVYRPANGQGEGAMLRRAGHDHGASDPPWLSIEQAEADCAAQEREVKERRKSVGEGATFHGQVIEAQWFRSGLQVPPNLALVDTPGFAQARTGFNEAKTDVLANRNGMAMRVAEVYELWYHRANCVLWAFKASRLEDADTQRVFDQLAGRGKPIVGVVTCVDLVPAEQRDELMARAQALYGSGVERLVPVVCKPGLPEAGLGVEQLRADVVELAGSGREHKIAETAEFVRWQAKEVADALTAIGDALIENAACLDLYCNGAAQVLLETVEQELERFGERCNSWASDRFGTLPGVVAPVLQRIAEDPGRQGPAAVFGPSPEARERYNRWYRTAVLDHLDVQSRYSDLETMLAAVAATVVAEGSRLAAGHRLRVASKTLGQRAELCDAQARIEPPTVLGLKARTTPMVPPSVAAGVGDLFTRLLGGPGQLSAGATDNAVRGVSALVRDHFESLRKDCSAYVQSLAERILDGADDAIASLYDSRDLRRLVELAAALDADLAVIDGKVCALSARRRYQSVYRLYAPRNDTRLAVIDAFGEWYDEHGQDLCASAIAAWPQLANQVRQRAASLHMPLVYASGRQRSELRSLSGRGAFSTQPRLKSWLNSLAELRSRASAFALVDTLTDAVPVDGEWLSQSAATALADHIILEHATATIEEVAQSPISYTSGPLHLEVYSFAAAGATAAAVAAICAVMRATGSLDDVDWFATAFLGVPCALLSGLCVFGVTSARSAARLRARAADDVLAISGMVWTRCVQRLNRAVFLNVLRPLVAIETKALDHALEGALSPQGEEAKVDDEQ